LCKNNIGGEERGASWSAIKITKKGKELLNLSRTGMKLKTVRDRQLIVLAVDRAEGKPGRSIIDLLREACGAIKRAG